MESEGVNVNDDRWATLWWLDEVLQWLICWWLLT
jgi:hypothetical protein